MDNISREICSNQDGLHKHLDATALKHRDAHFAKPFAEHSLQAFDQAQQWLAGQPQRPLIFDSCCGVGQSSRMIAAQYPDHNVVAVDKSADRLRRGGEQNPDNLRILRADLNDFYRLALEAGWKLSKHFVLYPNPWPKSAHLGRRWHGAPVFPAMVGLGGSLELRTNWRLYAEEFQRALELYGIPSTLSQLVIDQPLTPFEAKYDRSGQALWQLQTSSSQ